MCKTGNGTFMETIPYAAWFFWSRTVAVTCLLVLAIITLCQRSLTNSKPFRQLSVKYVMFTKHDLFFIRGRRNAAHICQN